MGSTAIDILGLSTFAGNDKGFKSVRGLKATFPSRKDSSLLETIGPNPKLSFPMRKDSTLLETGSFSQEFGSPLVKREQDSSIVSRTNLSILNAALRSNLPEHRIQMINSYKMQENRFKEFQNRLQRLNDDSMLDNDKTMTRKGKAVFVDRRQTNEHLRSNNRSRQFKEVDRENSDTSLKLLTPIKQSAQNQKLSIQSSSVQSSTGTIPKFSPRSLNGIDNSMANIDQLYKFTFCKIRTIQELVNEGEPPILDEEVLKKKVLSEMQKKLPIFSQKPPTLDELVQIAKEMGVILSYKMANQALYYARDYSSNDKKFDTYSLVKWFSDNISMLRSIEHGNNFRATHRSNYEKSQPTVKIFGAKVGFGGHFGSRANQVANQIFSPSQTLHTVQLNDISNSTLPRKMNQSPSFTLNGTIFRSLSKHSFKGVEEDVIEIGGIPIGVATQIEADSKNLLTQSISEIVYKLGHNPKSYKQIQLGLTQLKKESELASGIRGIEGAALSREFIRLKRRKEENGLQDFFAKLAKSNMQLSKVIKIQNILTKDYSERPNAYEIKSKISPGQKRRVHQLTMNIH